MAMSGLPHKSVRLRFRNPKYERIVRLNTESIARKMGFSEDDVFDLTLAVEEAYTNAIEHSAHPLASLEVEVAFYLFTDRLEVIIQDSGCGFVEEKLPSPTPLGLEDDPGLSHRGRGLELIRSLSDHSEILSAPGMGTLIKIRKFLRRESEDGPKGISPTMPGNLAPP